MQQGTDKIEDDRTDQPGDSICVDRIEDATGVAIGNGSQAAVGKNIIQIGTLQVPMLPLLVLVLLVVVGLVGTIAYIWWPRPLMPMAGEFNIAIAGFQQEGDSSTQYDIAQIFYSRLQAELGNLGTSLGMNVQLRGPGEIGVIRGQDDGERSKEAERVAGTIKADILIYGIVSFDGTHLRIRPQFYVGTHSFYEADEVRGNHRISTDIEVRQTLDPPLQKKEVNDTLAERSQVLALLVAGLIHYSIDDYSNALMFFKRAEGVPGWDDGRDVLYGFLGTSTLKLGQINQALAYCKKAQQLNPEYARAYICLGSVYYTQALGDPPPQSYAQVDVSMLDKAIDAYQHASAASEQPFGANVTEKVNLGLGQAHLVKALKVTPPDLVLLAQATSEFDAVISAYRKGANPRVQDLASHAYANRAAMFRMDNDLASAVAYFRQAYELNHNPVWRARYAASLAGTYLGVGNRQEALNWYDRAADEAPAGSPQQEEYRKKADELRSPNSSNLNV